MLFHSYSYFLIFLPIVIIIYFYLANRFVRRISIFWLIICSFAFYAWWNVAYLFLLLISIIVNYCISIVLIHPNRMYKQSILLFAIIFNLLLLGYYKYTNFFIDNTNLLINSHIPFINILLPLGISFFTFTQIAFLVDCYRHPVKDHKFINYFLFVSFFPHLLAGPIIHHAEIMPQFSSIEKKINYKNAFLALFLFVIGLFKKVVIADTFAIWATEGFDHSYVLDFFSAWQTSLSYTFQLYFDFSGYSDMAIASALFFNIKFPTNFFSPYKSTSIQSFWNRWHITLTDFLRNYLYIPLGGNRVPQWRIFFNVMITFLIGGLWHGPNWTFVFWGFLHGCASIIHRIWQLTGSKLHPIISWFITFNFINFTWVFFRAKTWHDAIKILQGMIDWNHLGHCNPISIIFILLAIIICTTTKNSIEIINSKVATKFYSSLIIASLATLSVTVLSIKDAHEFLYFQF